MRFLLLNQFYPPDPAPTGWYLHGLAQELARRGHEVKVLCSRGSYDGTNTFPPRQKLEGVEVVRLRATGFGRRGFVGKAADYATFCATLAAALVTEREKPDVILSLTTPPYLGVLGKAAAARHRCQHSHWIMDLYPDAIFSHGRTKPKSVSAAALRHLTSFQLRGAETVIALGAKMAEKVAGYTDGQSVAVVPLWSDPRLSPWADGEINPVRVQHGWNEDEVIFLYSGNMGLGHLFGDFLGAAKRLGATGPRWVFSGGGKRRQEIETFAGGNRESQIEFLDYVPQGQLRAHLGAADVHLASLDPAWQGVIVPSKIQASFAVARPVLFVGGLQSEAAAWIQESGGGWVVELQDFEGLLRAIRQAMDSPERRRRGVAALSFARKHFQISENCARLARLLEGGSALPDCPPTLAGHAPAIGIPSP